MVFLGQFRFAYCLLCMTIRIKINVIFHPIPRRNRTKGKTGYNYHFGFAIFKYI
jgi:hypothetical protein